MLEIYVVEDQLQVFSVAIFNMANAVEEMG